jgi:hypothetical protein
MTYESKLKPQNHIATSCNFSTYKTPNENPVPKKPQKEPAIPILEAYSLKVEDTNRGRVASREKEKQ